MALPSIKNSVGMAVTAVADSGQGTLTVGSALSGGYQTAATAYGANANIDIRIEEGDTWEVCRDCTYTHSGTTVTRGTLEDGSSGTSTRVAFTTAAKVYVVEPAARVERAIKNAYSIVPGGRLTLISGDSGHILARAVTISGQDTSANTLTITGHGLPVGTAVTSQSSSGGLTGNARYYCGNITTNTLTLHTTADAAIAGTSAVDITGTVTGALYAGGVGKQTLYYTPHNHAAISLWDGNTWVTTIFTEKSLALSGLTSDKCYDVFGYLSSGELALELGTEWASDTARASGSGGISLQDGFYCKGAAGSEDHTRLYLGTIYTTSTTSTEDSTSKRYVWNAFNRINKPLRLADDGYAGHTYQTSGYRKYNNGDYVYSDVVAGIGLGVIPAGNLFVSITPQTGSGLNQLGLNWNDGSAIDSNVVPAMAAMIVTNMPIYATSFNRFSTSSFGRYRLHMVERCTSTGGTVTWGYGSFIGDYLC